MLPIQPLLMRNEITSSGTNFGALVRKSSGDQTFGGVAGALVWDTEIYDHGNWHDVSSTGRMTVLAGVSLVRATANALSNSGSPLLQHRKGGSSVAGGGHGEGLTLANAGSAPLAVSASNYLEVYYSTSVGSSTPTNDEETWFAIERLDPTTKYALVTKSANQALAINTLTTLSWNTEVADTDGFHDNATNNSRLTVPAALNGKVVRLCANHAASTTAQAFSRITKNGTGVARGLPAKAQDTSSTEFINLVSAPISVVTGDYFETDCFMGAAGNVLTDNATWFSIEEVPSTYQRALVYKSANQTLSAGVGATLTFDSEVYDTASMHDTVTNNSRLTVPAGCTRARPLFGIITSSQTGRIHAWATKNGADYRGMASYDADAPAGDFFSAVGAWVDVTPGDYFQLNAFSTLARDVTNGNETWFCLECQ